MGNNLVTLSVGSISQCPTCWKKYLCVDVSFTNLCLTGVGLRSRHWSYLFVLLWSGSSVQGLCTELQPQAFIFWNSHAKLPRLGLILWFFLPQPLRVLELHVCLSSFTKGLLNGVLWPVVASKLISSVSHFCLPSPQYWARTWGALPLSHIFFFFFFAFWDRVFLYSTSWPQYPASGIPVVGYWTFSDMHSHSFCSLKNNTG